MANINIFICLVLVSIVAGGSPPLSMARLRSKFTSMKGIWLDNIQNQNPNVPLDHQTRSDAMQLYSINSKQIAKVKDISEKSWEQPNYQLTMTQKSRSRRDNKFVTETVSYQRLKIRSADNQKYLCARTNGEIVFKETADKEDKVTPTADGNRAYLANKADKKNKPRKRCLFHWEFTKQMHIQLSLEAGDKKRYYLSVIENSIKLRLKQETTEMERSFIWLPTKPLKGQTRIVSNVGRSRKFDTDTLFGTPPLQSICQKVVEEKDSEMQTLLKEVQRLKDEIEKMKLESAVSGN